MLGVGCLGAEEKGCRWMVFRGAREQRARMRGAKIQLKNQLMYFQFLLCGGFHPKEALNFVVCAAAEI